MPRYILFGICFSILQILKAQEPASFINVEIQPKQTFYSTARDFNVDIKLLKKYNEQYAPDYLIRIGDVVRVPIFEAKAPPINETKNTAIAQNKIHKVVKGETAYGLCKKYNITIQNLKQWNNMSSDLGLKLGQTLIVGKTNIDKSIPATTISTVNIPKENKAVSKPVQTIKEEIKQDALFTPPTKENEVKEEVLVVTKVQTSTPTQPTVEKTRPKESIIGKGINIMRGIGKTSNESALSSAAFAYYDYAKVGDNIKVVNLMSKKVYYMKVIGKIPPSEKDDETILVVSQETLQHLGTSENRFLVQISIQ